jgi:hypothetical protein
MRLLVAHLLVMKLAPLEFSIEPLTRPPTRVEHSEQHDERRDHSCHARQPGDTRNSRSGTGDCTACGILVIRIILPYG